MLEIKTGYEKEKEMYRQELQPPPHPSSVKETTNSRKFARGIFACVEPRIPQAINI